MEQLTLNRLCRVGDRNEPDHLGVVEDGHRLPHQPAGTDVRFGEADQRDWLIVGNEAQLLYKVEEDKLPKA